MMLSKKPEDGAATLKHVEEMEGTKESTEDVQAKIEEQEAELEDKTQARMEAVMGGEELPEDKPADDSEDQDEPTPEEKDKPAEEPDKDDEPTPEEKVDDGEVKDKDDGEKEIPPLSDAYYRAATHTGWTPEAIEEFYEATPELCIKTLGNIYESVNRSSQEFAAFGRVHKEQAAKAAQVAAQPVVPETSATPEFKDIDIKALEDSDADEATIATMRALNEQNKMIFDTLQKSVKVEPAQETVQPLEPDSNAALLGQQIDGFFANSTKGYEDFYGTEVWEKLSPGQQMNRWSAVKMMDEIIVGTAAYGREITVDDALQRAHLSVSQSERDKVIREELKSKLTKRSKSLSLKPSGSAKTDTGGKPKTEIDLLDRTQERLDRMPW